MAIAETLQATHTLRFQAMQQELEAFQDLVQSLRDALEAVSPEAVSPRALSREASSLARMVGVSPLSSACVTGGRYLPGVHFHGEVCAYPLFKHACWCYPPQEANRRDAFLWFKPHSLRKMVSSPEAREECLSR